MPQASPARAPRHCRPRDRVHNYSGIQVFDPGGALLGEIRLRGAVNFTFGGADGNVLFITTDEAVWAAELNVTAPTRARGA
jgi:sugar lactone lactonase YvrE